MAQERPKECSVVLAINQNGCLRKSNRSDELAALSLCNDPISLCSFVADERVSLAELHDIVIPSLPMPLDVALETSLVTGSNASFDFDVTMREERGGSSSWELRLGGSTEASISESVGDGSSSSDRDERAESGEGGSSVNGERGSLEGTGVRPRPGGEDGRVAIALGVISLSCPFGDALGVVTQNCAKINIIDTLENAGTHIEGQKWSNGRHVGGSDF